MSQFKSCEAMDFGRVEKEWDTSPPAPPPVPQIPSYSVPLQTAAGPGAAGMGGVQGTEQPPPIRIGRGAIGAIGATPASYMGSGAAPVVALNSGHKPTPTAAASNEDESFDAGGASYIRKLLRTELVANSNPIEVIRNDPNSPLYSVKSFEELNLQKLLLDGVYAMGFNKPSKIQETALPNLLTNPPINLIAQSQSGTGKTAAFVLAMLTRVDPAKHHPQILCLSPTYDLAKQTGEVLLQMGKYLTDINVIFALKATHKFPAKHRITEQIILGTPGTTLDWVRRKFFDPSLITMFVLDEADVMIATQGHQDQTVRIHNSLSSNIQGVLFSATYDDEVMKFAATIIPNPTVIRLKREEESLDSIAQYYIKCKSPEDKYQALANIYAFIEIGQTIVFCQTRRSAQFLAGKMAKDGHSVGILSGDMEISARVAVLNRFREGKEKLLITTNLCARGLDIEQITLVINYDLPLDLMGNTDFETYLHRIGRTGRFGKKGIAINFIDGPDSMQRLQMIQQHFGKPIKLLDTNDYDQLENIAV